METTTGVAGAKTIGAPAIIAVTDAAAGTILLLPAEAASTTADVEITTVEPALATDAAAAGWSFIAEEGSCCQ